MPRHRVTYPPSDGVSVMTMTIKKYPADYWGRGADRGATWGKILPQDGRGATLGELSSLVATVSTGGQPVPHFREGDRA